MAWENMADEGDTEIISGDKPIDEIALALDKIAKLYEERWERKPTFLEVIYAIDVVIKSNPESYVEDPENEKIEELSDILK